VHIDQDSHHALSERPFSNVYFSIKVLPMLFWLSLISINQDICLYIISSKYFILNCMSDFSRIGETEFLEELSKSQYQSQVQECSILDINPIPEGILIRNKKGEDIIL